MLCLQVATVNGPIVPVIARVCGDADAAVPIALPARVSLPCVALLARRAVLERFRAEHGDKRIAMLRRAHVARGGLKPETHSQRNLPKTLRGPKGFAPP